MTLFTSLILSIISFFVEPIDYPKNTTSNLEVIEVGSDRGKRINDNLDIIEAGSDRGKRL